MRIKLKYLLPLLFLEACSANSKQPADENIQLYPPPVTVALNLKEEGYTVNAITGDTIKPLINSFGDTVKTGIPIPFNGKLVDLGNLSSPVVTRAKAPPKVNIETNIHPVPQDLTVIPVDTARLKKVKLGEGDQSYVPKNSSGILQTGIPVPVIGKKMPFSEPQPVKALPFRFKDAATANVQYLDVDQGLSYSFVYDVMEDSRGNFWFAMDGTGVSKYDGVNLIHYTTKEGLSNNIVKSILEDNDGNLWFGTEGGVNKFDGENFVQFTEKEGLPANLVLHMYRDNNGFLWFCTPAGVSKYDGKHFINYTVKEGLPDKSVHCATMDKQGNMWFGTNKGVAKFDGKIFTCIKEENGLSGDVISSIIADKKGNIWIVPYEKGIDKYDGKTITHYSEKDGLSTNLTWSIFEDKKGNMWFGTRFGGINKYDEKTFTHYGLKEGLSNSKVRGITEDKNGNIWFGTDGGGVNKMKNESFNYRLPAEAIGNNRVRPIVKDRNGNLWMGTEAGGVAKYDAGGNDSRYESLIYYTAKDGISLGQRSIIQDKKGNIWIGSTGGGLIRYDGKRFINYSIKEGLSDITVFCLLEDKKENIWIGTGINGIDKFDGKNFTHYSEKDGLPAKRIFSMLEDKHSNIWFCTEGGGISKYDGANITTYTEKEGLFNNSVTSVAEDKYGNLWLGTLGAGVSRFDGKTFTYYTEREGLSNNNVWSIIEDSAGRIWAGTDKGLSLFIPGPNKQFVIQQFGLQDGLKALDFNLRSVCIDDNNQIWWGTGKNVVTLDLNKPIKAYDIRSLKLKYVEINEHFYDYRNLADSLTKNISFSSVIPFSNFPDKLRLSYNENHLTFHFSAIDWSAPHKIKYSYRMVGLDEQWSKPSEETFADYRSLDHGNYQFQVRAIGQSQVWTESFTYSFIIRPAWWQTWWFKAVMIAFALILVFFVARFIYYYQFRKQRALLEKQLAVQYERQRISSEMHDDIGAGLSGIKLMTEMAKKKSKDGDSVSEIEKIYQSVGDVSSKMKEVIWSLNTENDSLVNLVSYLQRQARLMMENYPCTFTMTLPDKTPDVKISGETRRHIYLAVKEALHNIIKHSGADKVNVTITCDDRLHIIVSDNGKGIHTQQDDSGNGLKNMRQRMKQVGGNFIIKNKEGLTLVFEIPLQTTV